MGAVRSRFAWTLEAVVGSAQVAVALVGAPLLRRGYLSWGATAEECAAPMPGDDLVAVPKLGYTRAVTVDAPPVAVWPWLAQIGQGRGGFYSFDALEDLARCRVDSADRVLAEHQHLERGDLVRLGPDGYPCFVVAAVEPYRSLVLVGADPATHRPPVLPLTERPDAEGATWQWLLRPLDGGTRTRLLVRQRLTFPATRAAMWRLVEPVNFVMERRMLRGIKARAEQLAAAAAA